MGKELYGEVTGGGGSMITIVNYGMGNLRSVQNALRWLGCESIISSDPDEICTARALILPGVGAFDCAMGNIRKRGLKEALDEAVLVRGVYVLGICLGMQLLASVGMEGGENEGLGWIEGRVERFVFDKPSVRVPHIGFSPVTVREAGEALFAGAGSLEFYFVHSYHMVCNNQDDVIATCDYHGDFVASVANGNILGTQFHPEKSQANGLALLHSFVNMVAARG